ncbi:putative RNA-binding domain superfamily [Helianthus anomalus]
MTSRKFTIPANIQKRLTKVFITNLSDKCSGNDLSRFIRAFGDIFDLYICNTPCFRKSKSIKVNL